MSRTSSRQLESPIFFGEQLLEMLFRYLGESFLNTIRAFAWPVYIIEISPPWGIAVFVLMGVLFKNFLKEPIEQWLFHEDDQPKV